MNDFTMFMLMTCDDKIRMMMTMTTMMMTTTTMMVMMMELKSRSDVESHQSQETTGLEHQQCTGT